MKEIKQDEFDFYINKICKNISIKEIPLYLSKDEQFIKKLIDKLPSFGLSFAHEELTNNK